MASKKRFAVAAQGSLRLLKAQNSRIFYKNQESFLQSQTLWFSMFLRWWRSVPHNILYNYFLFFGTNPKSTTSRNQNSLDRKSSTRGPIRLYRRTWHSKIWQNLHWSVVFPLQFGVLWALCGGISPSKTRGDENTPSPYPCVLHCKFIWTRTINTKSVLPLFLLWSWRTEIKSF